MPANCRTNKKIVNHANLKIEAENVNITTKNLIDYVEALVIEWMGSFVSSFEQPHVENTLEIFPQNAFSKGKFLPSKTFLKKRFSFIATLNSTTVYFLDSFSAIIDFSSVIV